MTKTMEAANIMRTRVAGIHPKASLGQAIELMANLDVTALPVVDVAGRLVGMLTAGDILRRTQIDAIRDDVAEPWGGSDGFEHVRVRRNAYDPTVSEVMTPEVCAVQRDVPAHEVVGLMKDRHIKRLPVLDGDKLVGMIVQSDIAQVFAEDFASTFTAATQQDRKIRDDILSVLRSLKWAPSPLIDIAVEHGSVELNGTLLKAEDRLALRNAIENIAGVIKYRDHLVLADSAEDLFPPSAQDMFRRQKIYC